MSGGPGRLPRPRGAAAPAARLGPRAASSRPRAAGSAKRRRRWPAPACAGGRPLRPPPASPAAAPPASDARPPGLDPRPPAPDARPPGLDARPPGLDLWPPGLDAPPLAPDARPPALDARLPAPDAWPPALDARLPAPDAWPPAQRLPDPALPLLLPCPAPVRRAPAPFRVPRSSATEPASCSTLAGDTRRGPLDLSGAALFRHVRRRPTLPRGPPRSTIGAEGLNFRVRNGTGCFPFAITAETLLRCHRARGRPYLGSRTVDAKQHVK